MNHTSQMSGTESAMRMDAKPSRPRAKRMTPGNVVTAYGTASAIVIARAIPSSSPERAKLANTASSAVSPSTTMTRMAPSSLDPRRAIPKMRSHQRVSRPTTAESGRTDGPKHLTSPPRDRPVAAQAECRKLAEGEGFEPPERLLAQRFSRPPHSTTLASLRGNDIGRRRCVFRTGLPAAQASSFRPPGAAPRA